MNDSVTWKEELNDKWFGTCTTMHYEQQLSKLWSHEMELTRMMQIDKRHLPEGATLYVRMLLLCEYIRESKRWVDLKEDHEWCFREACKVTTAVKGPGDAPWNDDDLADLGKMVSVSSLVDAELNVHTMCW